jgi:predicted nucleotidyltransferase
MFNLTKTLLLNAVRTKIPDVKLIYLFGSFASGEQHTGRDLDIASPTKGGLTQCIIIQYALSKFALFVMSKGVFRKVNRHDFRN